MSANLFSIIFFAHLFSSLIPLSMFLWRIKHQPRQNTIIAIILTFSLVCDLANWLLPKFGLSSAVFFHSYGIVAFMVFNFYYYELFFHKKASKYQYITILIFALTVVSYFSFNSGLTLSNYIGPISSAILGINSLLYFYFISTMIVERYFDMHLFSNFAVNASLSLYFFTTIILFSFMDFAFTELTIEQERSFWSIHNIINILKNIGIALGFFLSGKRNVYMTFSQLEELAEQQERDSHQ
ncbi:MAG TPA: hypothetical protein VGD65_05780 [Chryseosolibacter sp.]